MRELFKGYYGVEGLSKQQAKKAVEASRSQTFTFESEVDARLKSRKFGQAYVPVLPRLGDPGPEKADTSRGMVTYEIPFEGTGEVFFCQPSAITLPHPWGEVRGQVLVLTAGGGVAQARDAIQSNLTRIQEVLAKLGQEFTHAGHWVFSEVEKEFDARYREELSKKANEKEAAQPFKLKK